MKNSTAKRIAYYGMFVSLAFIFSYIEAIIPFSVVLPIPGFKLGLANIVVLIILYAMGPKEALAISVVRIVLAGFTFGNMFSIFYSMAGGLLSWLVMCLCKQIKKFSMVGVSIAGGITHNIGQIVVAIIVLENSRIGYYLPVLLIVGTITGFVIGILGVGLLKVAKKVINI